MRRQIDHFTWIDFLLNCNLEGGSPMKKKFTFILIGTSLSLLLSYSISFAAERITNQNQLSKITNLSLVNSDTIQTSTEDNRKQYLKDFLFKMESVGVTVAVEGLPTEEAIAEVEKAYFNFVNANQYQQSTATSEPQPVTSFDATEQYIQNMTTKLASVGVEVKLDRLTQEQALIELEKSLEIYRNSQVK